MTGVADLTGWLNRRVARPAPPPRPGRTILIHGTGTTSKGTSQATALALALASQGQGLHLLVLDREAAAAAQQLAARRARGVSVTAPDTRTLTEPSAARAFIATERPAAVIHLGEQIPVALFQAAQDSGSATTILAPKLDYGAAWWNAGALRRALGRTTRIFLTEAGARSDAIRHGIEPDRIEMVAPLDPAPEPLRYNRAELTMLHGVLQGRHVWFVAALPLGETQAVLDAHRAVLTYNHRALLIIAPMQARDAATIADLAEAADLTVARRADDDEPSPDYQVFVAEDLSELGLWYRLAAVTYIGGTLSGVVTRNPFEAASLGSALIHGPHIHGYDREWRQLDQAHAARRVASADGLAQVAADMSAPDQAAALALAAWTLATNGVAMAAELARTVLGDLDPYDGKAG